MLIINHFANFIILVGYDSWYVMMADQLMRVHQFSHHHHELMTINTWWPPLPLPLAPGVWLFGLHGVQALRHRGGGSVSRPQRRPVPGLPRRHGENQGGPQLWILSSWGDSQWHTARCTCVVGEVRWGEVVVMILFRGVMVVGRKQYGGAIM